MQLPRYWRYIRSTNELSVFYNASVLNVPSPEDVRVLGLRYLVVPTGIEPPVGGRVVEDADGYSLWELDDTQPLSTVTSMVAFVHDLPSAMDEVTTSGFDPSEQAVLETTADVFTCVGCTPTVPAVTTAISGSELTIQIPESGGGILTIRNAYEAGWRAVVDGRAATTIPVDGFLQGVILPQGAREVVLTYHDDAVMLGLAVGAGIWLVLLSAPLVALAFERRRREGDGARPTRPPPPDA